LLEIVFFDFDGVLTLEDRGSTVTIGAIHDARPDLSYREIADSYYRFHGDIMLGKQDHTSVWDDFCRAIGAQIDISLLEAAFLATPINEPAVDIARRISVKCPVGIITANGADRMEAIVSEHGFAELFDPIVISAHVGAMKTERLIFEKALNGLRPDRCAFIDNQEKNLAVPSALGIHTFHFDTKRDDTDALRRQLARWGLVV
jgi:putative hydrolase of the HAD superfamily